MTWDPWWYFYVHETCHWWEIQRGSVTEKARVDIITLWYPNNNSLMSRSASRWNLERPGQRNYSGAPKLCFWWEKNAFSTFRDNARDNGRDAVKLGQANCRLGLQQSPPKKSGVKSSFIHRVSLIKLCIKFYSTTSSSPPSIAYLWGYSPHWLIWITNFRGLFRGLELYPRNRRWPHTIHAGWRRVYPHCTPEIRYFSGWGRWV